MAEVLEVKQELTQVIDYGLVAADLQTKVTADLALTIDGPSDKAGYKLCDTRRKEWVKVRTSIDKRRKEMNAAARDHIKRVDAVAAELTEIAGQAEEHVTRLVDEIDAAVEKAKQDALDVVFNARNSQLQHVGLNLPRLLIESMTDEQIEQQITDKVEMDRLRKAEADRLAEAKAAADKLAAEQAEANRIEAEQLAADRAAFAEQQAEHKRDMERQQSLIADKLAADRAELARMKAAIDREREAVETAEAIRLADEKHAADMAEKLRVEAEQAERDRVLAELMRPGREQLLMVAAVVEQTGREVLALVLPAEFNEIKQKCGRIILDAAENIRRVLN